MTRLAGYLARRVWSAALFAALLCGLVVVAGVGDHGPPLATWGALTALAVVAGVALLAAPIAVFAATAWLCVQLSVRGRIEMLQSCGVTRRQVAGYVASAAFSFALCASLGLEALLPAARSALVPSIAWEMQSTTPVVLVVGDTKIAAKFGDTLTHLRDAWVWENEQPRHFADLHYVEGVWRNASGVPAVLPPPDTFISQRVYLFELLTLRELLRLDDLQAVLRGHPGIVLVERLLRPFMLAIWSGLLAALLLARRRSLLAVVVLTVTVLAAAAVALMTARQLATVSGLPWRWLLLAMPLAPLLGWRANGRAQETQQ